MADQPASLSAIGDQKLVVSNSAVRLTMPVPTGAPQGATPRHALISVEGDAVRWLGGQAAGGGAVVGTTPTSTVGILVPSGGFIDWTDVNGDFYSLIKYAQFIRVTTDSTLNIVYFT